MRCPPERVLYALAEGRARRWSDRLRLRHIRRCPRCRARFLRMQEEARRNLLLLAGRDGLRPERPDELKARIFDAIRRDRMVRPTPRIRRTLARTAIAAAAAVVLVAAVARFLGEQPRWLGRLDRLRGAPLLTWSDEEGLVVRSAAEPRIGPGEVLVLLPGARAVLDLGDAGEVAVRGPACVGFDGNERGIHLYLGRGTVNVERRGGRDLEVVTGEQAVRPGAVTEFEVIPERKAEALAWVTERTREARRASFRLLGSTSAFAEPSPIFASRVTVHAVLGSTVSRDGSLLPPGYEAVLRRGGGWRDTGPAGSAPYFPFRRPARLTDREREAARHLAGRSGSATDNLLRAAADPRLPAWQRGLAVWLLADLGDPRAVPGLRRLGDPALPVTVRAAVVRALFELDPSFGDAGPAAFGPEPAVAEAWVQGLARARGPRAGPPLARLASDPARPPFLRALAAAEAEFAGTPVSPRVLGVLRRAEDPDAARIADDLLAGRRDPESADLLRAGAAEGPAADRARAFAALAARSLGGLETEAAAILAGADRPEVLRAAALRYLGAADAGKATPFLGSALSRAPGPLREAALEVLWTRRSRVDFRRYADRVEALLAADPAPAEIRLAVGLLREAGSADPLFRLLSHPSGYVRADALRALQQLATLGVLPSPDSEKLLQVAREAIRDRFPLVRRRAWELLAQAAPDRALAALGERLRAGTSPPAALAARVLKAAAGAARPGELLAVARELCAPNRPASLQALGADLPVLLPPGEWPRARREVLALLSRKDPTVRAGAHLALGGPGDAAAARRDPDPRVRLAALGLCLREGGAVDRGEIETAARDAAEREGRDARRLLLPLLRAACREPGGSALAAARTLLARRKERTVLVGGNREPRPSLGERDEAAGARAARAGEILARGAPQDAPRAALQLGALGGRAGVALLAAAAEASDPRLAAAAGRAFARLAARTREGTAPRSLARWWNVRAYALDIPVLAPEGGRSR